MHRQFLRKLICFVCIKYARWHIFDITTGVIEYLFRVTRLLAVGVEAFLGELLM